MVSLPPLPSSSSSSSWTNESRTRKILTLCTLHAYNFFLICPFEYISYFIGIHRMQYSYQQSYVSVYVPIYSVYIAHQLLNPCFSIDSLNSTKLHRKLIPYRTRCTVHQKFWISCIRIKLQFCIRISIFG